MFQTLLLHFSLVAIEDTREANSRELSESPQSDFTKDGFPRKAEKSKLYEIFSPTNFCDLTSRVHVIDGGCLLWIVMWDSGKTFGQICQDYGNRMQKLFSVIL